MRILQLSGRNIWPLNTGAKLREFHLAREVAGRARLTYVGFWEASERPPEPCPALALLPGAEDVVMVPKERCYGAFKLLRGAVGTPITILNYTTECMAATLERLLADKSFDIAQIEGIHVFGYLPLLRRAGCRIVCDWHNVESELLRRYSEHEPNLARRLYARRTARRLEKYESRLIEECDSHVVSSERERQHLLNLVPGADVRIVENGVDVDAFDDPRPPARAARRRIVFVGSMDYHANIDGVLWFARTAWPKLRQRLPESVFTIVGRDPAPQIRSLAAQPGIEVTGTVDDVRPYYRDAVVAVVPLRVGSGTRLKIPEAMAAGVPVVSTRLGAEGLEVAPGGDILIADTVDTLVEAVAEIASNDGLWAELSAAGFRLARARYDWRRAAQPLIEMHQTLAQRAQAAAAP